MPKVKLSQTYLYRGRHYGPGEVEIEDTEVAKALQERDAGILAARRPQMDQGSVDGNVSASRPVEPPRRTELTSRKGA